MLSALVAAALACGDVREYRVTAYCDRGVTASGEYTHKGTCAAPACIPFGSIVYVPSLGERFVVTDRTAMRFRHNTVDVWMPTRAECIRFGVRHEACFVVRQSSLEKN